MMEVTPISSEHTALVNSMCHVRGKKWLVSGGADKRVLAYDLGHQKIVWRKMLPASVSVVQEVCVTFPSLSRGWSLTTPRPFAVPPTRASSFVDFSLRKTSSTSSTFADPRLYLPSCTSASPSPDRKSVV